MSKLLKEAFAAASKLPQDEQDALARLLLAELDSERRWSEAFTKSQNELTVLAEEAVAEFRARPAGP